MTTRGFSEYGYAIKAPAAPLPFNNNAPASAGQFRDIVNNQTHLADEGGQVWCSMGIDTAALLTSDGTNFTAPVHLFRAGPYAIHTRPVSSTTGSSAADGGGYSLRVRLGGSRVNSNGNALFVVVAGPYGDSPTGGTGWGIAQAIAAGAGVPANAATVTISSTGTTAAWLTLSTDILTLTSSQLAPATLAMPTIDFNGNPTFVTGAWIIVDVFGAASGTSNQPQFAALYAAEYVGG